MSGVLDSIDNMLDAAADGMWRRHWLGYYSSSSAATIQSGYINCARFPQTIAAPAPGAGYAGMYVTYARMIWYEGTGAQAGGMICGLEYVLGTLTVSGNSFADGVTMPTKSIAGTAVQTCTDIAFMYVDTTLTATTPTVTITYKNERGTGSRTATLVTGTSPVANTAYLINPHLQAGDTGIQDVTNISISTGSAGVLKVTGVLLLGMASSSYAGSNIKNGCMDMFASGWAPYLVESGDKIAFYSLGDALSGAPAHAVLAGVGETT